MIYLNNSLGNFMIKTKNYIRDKNFLSEDFKISTNRIFLNDTPGVGTVFRGWTNMEGRQVTEFQKGENRRQLTSVIDGQNLESKN
jgi:hypothetical protein